MIACAWWSCRSFESPDRESLARQWSETLCERREACGCSDPECRERESNAMLEAWSDTEEQRVLDEGCWAERLRALEDLACEQAEDHVFAWELAACPIWTTFRSIGEPCGLFEGALASSCEAGLVCDHRSKRCVDASTPVAVGTPCLESADEYGSRGYCGTAGRCDEMGVCQVDDGSAHEPLPVLVCSSSVRVF